MIVFTCISVYYSYTPMYIIHMLRVYIYMYIYIYIHTYVCVYVYIYIYTHTIHYIHVSMYVRIARLRPDDRGRPAHGRLREPGA